jgi:hypothetical protein
LINNVEKFGFSIILIETTDYQPSFGYPVGLLKVQLSRREGFKYYGFSTSGLKIDEFGRILTKLINDNKINLSNEG